MVAIGAANVLGGIFGAVPASGSLSRTRLADLAGMYISPSTFSLSELISFPCLIGSRIAYAGSDTPAVNFVAAVVGAIGIQVMLPLLRSLPKAIISCITVKAILTVMDFHEVRLSIIDRDQHMYMCFSCFSFQFSSIARLHYISSSPSCDCVSGKTRCCGCLSLSASSSSPSMWPSCSPFSPVSSCSFAGLTFASHVFYSHVSTIKFSGLFITIAAFPWSTRKSLC